MVRPYILSAALREACLFLILVDCQKYLALKEVDSVNIIPYGS